MPQMMPQTSGVSGNDFWTLGTGTGIAEHIPKYWEWEWKIANYMLNSRSRKHLFFEHRSAIRGGAWTWTLQVLQLTWKLWVGEPDYLDPNLLQEQPLANYGVGMLGKIVVLPTFSEVKMSWILFSRKDQWLLLMDTLAGSCSTCWPAWQNVLQVTEANNIWVSFCRTGMAIERSYGQIWYLIFQLTLVICIFWNALTFPWGKTWRPMQHPVLALLSHFWVRPNLWSLTGFDLLIISKVTFGWFSFFCFLS